MKKDALVNMSSYTNSFKKIEHIKSHLLWGDPLLVGQPYITFIVPTFRRPDTLKQALNSICQQKRVEFEWNIIVMDNNPDFSDETTLNCVREINDKRILYYKNEMNLGHEGNINRGFELAKGKWIALLHDDDLLVENYLQLIQQYIKKCGKMKKPLAYIRARHIGFMDGEAVDLSEKDFHIENRIWIRPELRIESVLRGGGPTFINSCGSLVNREAFFDIGGYNSDLDPIADATLGLILEEKYSVISSGIPLGYYRKGKNQSSQKQMILNFIEADFLLREFLYKEKLLYKIFGFLFREAQFKKSVDYRLKEAKMFGIEISKQEIDTIHRYKDVKLLSIGLAVIKRLFLLIYRPMERRRRGI